MRIYKIKTKNWREFKVVCKDWDKTLEDIIREHNKKEPYEAFQDPEIIMNWIHDLKTFKKLVTTLI